MKLWWLASVSVVTVPKLLPLLSQTTWPMTSQLSKPVFQLSRLINLSSRMMSFFLSFFNRVIYNTKDVHVSDNWCFTCTSDRKLTLSQCLQIAGRPIITVILRCHTYLNKMMRNTNMLFQLFFFSKGAVVFEMIKETNKNMNMMWISSSCGVNVLCCGDIYWG